MRLDHLLSKEKCGVKFTYFRSASVKTDDRSPTRVYRCLIFEVCKRLPSSFARRKISIEQEYRSSQSERRCYCEGRFFRGKAKRPRGVTGFLSQRAKKIWGFSSAGRAPALQAGGQRFDPANLHQYGPIAQLVRAHD